MDRNRNAWRLAMLIALVLTLFSCTFQPEKVSEKASLTVKASYRGIQTASLIPSTPVPAQVKFELRSGDNLKKEAGPFDYDGSNSSYVIDDIYIGTYDVVRSHRFAMEQYRPLVAVQTRKEFKPKNPFSIDGSDKIVLSNYQIQNKGKSNTIRLLSLSENDEEVSLLWAKKQPKSITYVDNGEKIKLPKKETRITVPAKGIRTLQIEW